MHKKSENAVPAQDPDRPQTPAAQLTNLAFTVLHDVYRLGDRLAAIDLDQLSARIGRIHDGMNPQNEFQGIVSWLGQCTTINAIQDSGTAEADPAIRAPDYLLVSKVNGRDLPVLVEVKTTNDDELVWSDKYLSSLRRFADILHLPLLVAWKHHGLWTLVDTAHFELRQTAYHLSFEHAMKENLMFPLCGEVYITLDPEFQFIITGDVAEPLPPQEELIPAGFITITMTDIGFFTRNGRLTGMDNELFWLFAACNDTNHVERPTRQTIKAVHHAEPETIFPLTRVLIAQIAYRMPDDASIDWNAELRRPFPSTGKTYRDLLHRGVDLGILQYGIMQVPNTNPPFLTPQQDETPAAG
jgi:hypothetical protein